MSHYLIHVTLDLGNFPAGSPIPGGPDGGKRAPRERPRLPHLEAHGRFPVGSPLVHQFGGFRTGNPLVAGRATWPHN